MKTIGKRCVNRPVTRSQIQAWKTEREKLRERDMSTSLVKNINVLHGLDSPDLKDKRGKKRPPMKTMGTCCVNCPMELPERDIIDVYGLDSPVDDLYDYEPPGPTMKRDIRLVCGLDSSAVLSDNPVTSRKTYLSKTTAMDDIGRVFYTSVTSSFPGSREKLLLEAWPAVVSSLNSVGISGSLNLVNPFETEYGQAKLRSITFSTTLTTRGGLAMIDKAFDLLEILTFSNAPPLLAIQILDGSLQYKIIRTGIINGFGSQIPFEKQQEKVPDLLKSIERSIKELEKMSQCYIFLNGVTVIALGNSQSGLKLVWYFVRACYSSSLKPEYMIRALNYFLQNGGKLENVETNILGFEPENASLCGPSLNQDGVLVCGAFFTEYKGKVLGKAWSIVQSTLEKYGISSAIYLDEGFLTISTKDQNMIHKARDVLELLALTSAAPSRALLVLTDGMKHDIIKTGYQNGGLGQKVKMNKKQFTERAKLIWACRQDLEKVTSCDIYLNGNTVAVIALEPERLSLVRNLVTRCIVGMENPASMIEEIELEPEKKRQKILN